MKIHILFGGALLALVLLTVEGRSFHGRGGRDNRQEGGRRNFKQVCNQPAESGMCYASMRMWFYNSTSETCETFTYGGCGGNANRFWTQRACNKRCSDPCNKPLDMGDECLDGTPGKTRTLYYYNSEENTCKEFEFTGCGGNRNRFRSVTHCERRCIDSQEESDSSEDVEDLSGSEDSDVSEHGFFSEPESYDDFGPFFEEDDDDDNSRSRRALRRQAPEILNGCPRYQCMMYCQYGFQIDPETGCSICRCNSPPIALSSAAAQSSYPSHCSKVMCRLGCKYGFQTGEDGCPICRCNPPPVDRCPPLCRMACPNGFKTRADGCPICECKPAAVGIDSLIQPRFTAAQSEEEEETEGMDKEEEEITIVRRRCPRMRCRRRCQFGFQKDEMGCDKCVCNQAPSQDQCASRPMCLRFCPNGFEVDDSGCPICRCKPGEDVTRPRPRACRPMMCFAPCLHGSRPDSNGCPTCDCLPPPSEGTELDEDATLEEAEPRLTLESHCPRIRCLKFCPWGYEKDSRGCDTCVCSQAPGGLSRGRQRRSVPKAEFLPNIHTPHNCKPIRCMMWLNCPFGRATDRDGCSSCECRATPKDAACYQPKAVGPCMALIPRFFYNSESGKCEPFSFGGCRGNGNNFRSLQDCSRTCEN